MVFFLAHKNESFRVFEVLCKNVHIEQGFCISSIRSDHDTQFENGEFKKFRDFS